MSQAPYFHQPSGSVRFWVLVGQQPVSATIGRYTLHYRYQPLSDDDDALQTYLQHAAEIDEAVRRRVAAGAREPVMLQDGDVRPVPGAADRATGGRA